MDGIINQGTFSSTYAVAPIIDAIEEFKVHSHNDDAEFGEVTGGIINVVTKSGTNRFHDAAWDRVPSVDNKYRPLPRSTIARARPGGQPPSRLTVRGAAPI